MYQHIKSLAKAGGVDVPYGTSMEREGGAGASHAPPRVDPKSTSAVAAAIAASSSRASASTSISQVGMGRVAGFGRPSGPSTSIHNHEDAFQRKKGVVNTVGGASDINVVRAASTAAVLTGVSGGLPGGRKARIVTMDTVDTLTGAGAARIEARARREAAESGGSGRGGGKAPVGGGGVHVSAPVKEVPRASRVSRPPRAPLSAPRGVASGAGGAASLGGGESGGGMQRQHGRLGGGAAAPVAAPAPAVASRPASGGVGVGAPSIATTTSRVSVNAANATTSTATTNRPRSGGSGNDTAVAALHSSCNAGTARGADEGTTAKFECPGLIATSSSGSKSKPKATSASSTGTPNSLDTRAAIAAHRAAHYKAQFAAESAHKLVMKAAAEAND